MAEEHFDPAKKRTDPRLPPGLSWFGQPMGSRLKDLTFRN
jgi:hypothetical protein